MASPDTGGITEPSTLADDCPSVYEAYKDDFFTQNCLLGLIHGNADHQNDAETPDLTNIDLARIFHPGRSSNNSLDGLGRKFSPLVGSPQCLSDPENSSRITSPGQRQQRQHQQHQQQQVAERISTSQVTSEEDDAVTKIFSLGLPIQNTLQDTPCGTCACLEGVMRANTKATQRTLAKSVGASHRWPTFSVDDVLQSQKDTLSSCERLLDCERCSSQLNNTMLIISMCRNMIGGLDDLYSLTLPELWERDDGPMKRKRTDAQGRGASTVTGAGNRYRAGSWRLDDADEMHALRGLVDVRISRLNSLMSQLQNVVNKYHFIHEWTVSALRLTLMDRIIALGLRRGT